MTHIGVVLLDTVDCFSFPFADLTLCLTSDPISALEKAKIFFTEKGWQLESSYVFFLRPGCEVKWNRTAPFADVYDVAHSSGKTCDYEPCLFRLSLTPEYDTSKLCWVFPSVVKTSEGKSRPLTQQMLRDCTVTYTPKCLEARLQQCPENSFVYSQTLFLLKRYSEALVAISRCSALPKEETWALQHMRAVCLSKQMKEAKRNRTPLDTLEAVAITAYLKAYSLRPNRAETLYALVKLYRKQGHPELAALFASRCMRVGSPSGSLLPYPNDDHLLLQPAVYEYLASHELALSGCKTQSFKQDGFDANESLLLSVETPRDIKESVAWCSAFYLDKLACEWLLPIAFTLPVLSGEVRADLIRSSPSYTLNSVSFCRQDKTFQLLVNAKNSDSEGCMHADGIQRHCLYIVKCDSYLKIVSQREIVLPDVWYDKSVDNCSLFLVGSRLWFSCSLAGKTMLCRIGKSLDAQNRLSLDKVVSLSDPTSASVNVAIPYVTGSDIEVITSLSPFTKYKPLTDSDRVTVAVDADLSSFTYGTVPILFDNGYLLVVRSTLNSHRLLFLDKQYKPCKLSLPFIFEHDGFASCYGVETDMGGKQLMFSCVQGNQICIYGISNEKARKMLRDLEQEGR